MCPTCITGALFVGASATSTGGLTALALKKSHPKPKRNYQATQAPREQMKIETMEEKRAEPNEFGRHKTGSTAEWLTANYFMSCMGRLNRRRRKWSVVGLLCSLTFVTGVFAQSAKQMIVIPFHDTKFVPLDPAKPQGSQLAVLWGDPANGPSAMLVKFKKGVGPLHYHTSDYHLTVLQGTMKHWTEGEREEDAKVLGPGSYWFQPGNQPHADACLTNECVTFVYWTDARDWKLVDTPKP
jgi:quercetin dioxygenase-like cupin family protein